MLVAVGYGLPHLFAVVSHSAVEHLTLLKEAVPTGLVPRAVLSTDGLTSEIQAFRTLRAGCPGTKIHLICWHVILQPPLW